jgi:Gly-Xaa carboxypeptidase
MALSSSVAAVQQRDTLVLKHLAKEFNLTYTAFGSAISTQDGPAAGALVLSELWRTGLEPAPVTPSDEDSAPWRLFSGTIKATFNAHRDLDGPNNIFVSPGIMSGNTGECTRPVRVQSKLDNINVGRCHRYEVLLESHAPHLPVQPPKRGER